MRRRSLPLLHEGYLSPALIGIYVDDLIFAGGKPMQRLADPIASGFPGKPATALQFPFSSSNKKREEKTLFIRQPYYCVTIVPLKSDTVFDFFRRLRHQLASLSLTRPDILASIN